jgi:antitoxin ParD1/3/4
MERLTITLTPDLAERVREAVAKGQYASSSEVIRDALREWELSQLRRQRALSDLRAEIDKGLADVKAGRVSDFDVRDIIKEGKKRLTARRSRSG